MLRNNPPKFWKVISPNNSQPLALFDEQNRSIPDRETSEKLNGAISSVFTIQPDNTLPLFPDFDHAVMPDVTFVLMALSH